MPNFNRAQVVVPGQPWQPVPLLERFEAKIEPEPNSGCWLWTGRADHQGYGQLWNGKRLEGVHRIAYRLFKGEPGKGVVCHRCDNPACCNPDHLFLSDKRGNAQDARDKGREKREGGRFRKSDEAWPPPPPRNYVPLHMSSNQAEGEG